MSDNPTMLPNTSTTRRLLPRYGEDERREYIVRRYYNLYKGGCQAMTGHSNEFEGYGIDEQVYTTCNHFCGRLCVYLQTLGQELPVCATHLTRFYTPGGNLYAERFAEAAGIDFNSNLSLMREILQILDDLASPEDHGIRSSIASLKRRMLPLEREEARSRYSPY